MHGQIISCTAYKNKKRNAQLVELKQQLLHLDLQYAAFSSPDLFKQKHILQSEFGGLMMRADDDDETLHIPYIFITMQKLRESCILQELGLCFQCRIKQTC